MDLKWYFLLDVISQYITSYSSRLFPFKSFKIQTFTIILMDATSSWLVEGVVK